MMLKNIQKEVDQWITLHKIAYRKPHEILTRITEEVGELAREINHTFGPKPKKSSEERNELANEMGDVLFSLCCLANSLNIDLDHSFKNAMDKCYGGDSNRFEKKDILNP